MLAPGFGHRVLTRSWGDSPPSHPPRSVVRKLRLRGQNRRWSGCRVSSGHLGAVRAPTWPAKPRLPWDFALRPGSHLASGCALAPCSLSAAHITVPSPARSSHVFLPPDATAQPCGPYRGAFGLRPAAQDLSQGSRRSSLARQPRKEARGGFPPNPPSTAGFLKVPPTVGRSCVRQRAHQTQAACSARNALTGMPRPGKMLPSQCSSVPHQPSEGTMPWPIRFLGFLS